ncbi:hypothetical protein IL54_0004 [Sphingobium sp. ba1]|nr:hypothetical protein IL54_0004 [Sphingobium sp. ba1]
MDAPARLAQPMAMNMRERRPPEQQGDIGEGDEQLSRYGDAPPVHDNQATGIGVCAQTRQLAAILRLTKK